MAKIDRITPCLWFDDEAEHAAKYYVKIFKNSKIKKIGRYGETGHAIHGRPAGSVMIVEFTLDGQTFTALNGGPMFKFTEAVSLQVRCKDQKEVDHYWKKLGEGGDPKPRSAAGSRTSTGSPGRSCRTSCRSSWATTSPSSRSARSRKC